MDFGHKPGQYALSFTLYERNALLNSHLGFIVCRSALSPHSLRCIVAHSISLLFLFQFQRAPARKNSEWNKSYFDESYVIRHFLQLYVHAYQQFKNIQKKM